MKKKKNLITDIKRSPSNDLIVILKNGRRVIFKNKKW